MNINIALKDNIIPMYDDVLQDILEHRHVHYIFPGGRGSTKSSFVGGIALPLMIIQNPNIHAVCFRKIGNTIQNSIYAQVTWGIYKMGLQDLFSVPKRYNTPIIYKPTGQRILFMGLDDPQKVKSIKLPFGYIGVTWWEELDQFAGEKELRTTLQSTMRGGDKFWDFRTFNPPISRNNWANEYVERAETDEKTKENTLIVRNTYLDVPREWLGEQFFSEAEELKRTNLRAYEHEYMGKAVGTGGNVFENVEDMDMTQMIDTVVGKKPLYQTFDNIYNGLDWGYAVDPTQFVKMHLDTRKHDLYVYDEYRTNGTRNVEIFEELYQGDNPHVFPNELITADSAEPKSISDFKAFGSIIRGAEKGPESVRYGIKWLQSLRHIYIDKRRCPHTFKEFVTYEYERDKEGNIISQYPDKDNHSIDAVRYALERHWKRKGQ